MTMSRELRAALVREIQEIREHTELLLEMLLPDESDCHHPPPMVEDRSTMGEPEFVCRACGATQDHPFQPSQTTQE